MEHFYAKDDFRFDRYKMSRYEFLCMLYAFDRKLFLMELTSIYAKRSQTTNKGFKIKAKSYVI